MKKILILFLIFFCTSCYAADSLSFIYINGSNNNDSKMKNWYEKGVNKLHPTLRKKFLKNRQIKKYYSSLGGINIKEQPVIFFWGYNSKNDLNFVKSQLKVSKMVSSTGAYIVRNLITEFLHDAIWVQKPHNMLPILDELNEQVKIEAKEGNGVILYGYSAGTFVTYEYMFNKLRYINIENLFKALKQDDLSNFIKNNPKNNTCISALTEDKEGLGTLSSSGHLILKDDKTLLKSNYMKLDDLTENYCAPDNMIKGVVNFASPLVLFYSDMSDENYELNYYNKLMIKYVLQNEIFMMTVNFKEDPLGFPTNRNMTVSEMEQRLDISIDNPKGVIYDNSSIWSKRMFPFAHTSYWSAKGTFSNSIVKSFITGYKFLYDTKYQQKVIKKNRKKSEL
ncbi:MAG: hypothetical protein IJ877_03730 [Candidatus Gastranaerophilales bacterium]|nr:hypothetical protein [Candidatus Gastranaerophilales bacterium]